MPRSLDEKNRHAPEVNPAKSGIRTGNAQLESHEPREVRSSPRQRKPRRPGAVKAKQGERRGG
jgi:hypothetical protein